MILVAANPTLYLANEHVVQGVCKNGVCVCTQGYRGDYCEIAPACSGILDKNGNCCPNGIVSVNGTCCSTVSPLMLSLLCWLSLCASLCRELMLHA